MDWHCTIKEKDNMTFQFETELYKHFNLTSFRDGQREVIEHVMNRKDVLAVMPTGTGKSLCYQLPSKLLPNPVVVISPLLSLMFDQVKKLKATGYKQVVAINSMMDYQQRKTVLRQLQFYKLIYVSPEIFQSQEVLSAVQKVQPSLLVIDEAHCISQWGHEFRPDYLRLKHIHESIGKPPLLALTATATPDVQKDIVNYLQMNQPVKVIFPIDKPNLSFVVEKINHPNDKINRLIALLEEHPVPTMIYFSSRKAAEHTAAVLQHSLNIAVGYYHGGLSTEDRMLIQEQFMRNELTVICCTSAFGMGIDKPDIRQVIHYHIPTQVESFIQEVGRGGRDGLPALSIAFYHPSDIHFSRNLLMNELPSLPSIKHFIQFIYTNRPSYQLVEDYIRNNEDLKETHERFLFYHLEKYGILKNKKIDASDVIKEELFLYFETIIKERMDYKHEKLIEMISLVETEECRREALFQTFQETVQKPDENCCNNCGFDWRKWKPVNRKLKVVKKDSWEQRLSFIMLQDVLTNE